MFCESFKLVDSRANTLKFWSYVEDGSVCIGVNNSARFRTDRSGLRRLISRLSEIEQDFGHTADPGGEPGPSA